MKKIKTPLEYLRYKHKHNPLEVLVHTTIGTIIVMLIIIIILIIANVSKYNWDLNKVYYNGVRPSLVVTGSMEPTIMTNAVVMMEPVDFEDIDINDIIVYNCKEVGYNVVHRVVAIGLNELYTKGDNNDNIDRWAVTENMVNGRVVSIYNETAPFISKIFGKFDMNNIEKSIFRIAIGFIIVALVVAGIILALYYTFDIITSNYYWTKKRNRMSDSIDWMDNRVSRDGFNSNVDRYSDIIKDSNIIKKVWLAVLFRKYYSVLCSEEDYAIKSKKYQKIFESQLERCSKKN